MKKLLLAMAVLMSLMGCSEPSSTTPKEEPKKQMEITKPLDNEMSVAEYQEKVSGILLDASDEVGVISDLYTQAVSNPALIQSEEWRNKLKHEYAIIEDHYNTLKSMNIPNEAKDVHQLILESFKLLILSNSKTMEGIETSNPALIQEGNDLMTNSIQLMYQAGDKMKELK